MGSPGARLPLLVMHEVAARLSRFLWMTHRRDRLRSMGLESDGSASPSSRQSSIALARRYPIPAERSLARNVRTNRRVMLLAGFAVMVGVLQMLGFPKPAQEPVTAFVDVGVIPMTGDGALDHQTVIVR